MVNLTVYFADETKFVTSAENRDRALDILDNIREGYSPGGMEGWKVSPVVEYCIRPVLETV